MSLYFADYIVTAKLEKYYSKKHLSKKMPYQPDLLFGKF